jgi:MFS family permease
MDFQIYTFAIPALMAIWKLSPGDAGLIATVALLVSAFGGWITGILSDRFGRVLMLQITIAWFAFFTFLQGFSPGFHWLLITRGLQGLGFGGEWAAGSVLMGEVIRKEHRGKAVGAVQSSWSVGWGAAALLATFFFQTMPREYGWRALFFVGLLPALFIFFIRRAVPEPEIFRDTKAASNGESGVLAIFRLELLRRILLGSLLAVGAQGGYYAITTWLPTFLQKERGLTILKSGYYATVIIVGSFVGYLVSAYLSDRLGRRANFVLFAVYSFLVVVIYTQVAITDNLMLILGFPLGFFASGVFSGMGAFYTELFPTEVRGSAQGLNPEEALQKPSERRFRPEGQTPISEFGFNENSGGNLATLSADHQPNNLVGIRLTGYLFSDFCASPQHQDSVADMKNVDQVV